VDGHLVADAVRAGHRGDASVDLGGVDDNRPEALELRCRKHNPRGAPTHKR
jgi:hypothetical protein